MSEHAKPGAVGFMFLLRSIGTKGTRWELDGAARIKVIEVEDDEALVEFQRSTKDVLIGRTERVKVARLFISVEERKRFYAECCRYWDWES